MKSSVLILITVLLFALLLSSCGKEQPRSQSLDVLAESFLDHLLADRYDEAYAILSDTVSEADFALLWNDLRAISVGATAYDLNWKSFEYHVSSDRPAYHQQTYILTFDHGRTLTLSVTNDEGTTSLSGLYFRDITGFRQDYTTVNIILGGLALLFMAFRAWMLVDCIRSRIPRKALWIILILLSVTMTVRLGDYLHVGLGMAVVWEELSVLADPVAYALIIRLSVPLGAILYFFLRKRRKLPTPDDATTSPLADETSGADPYDLGSGKDSP